MQYIVLDTETTGLTKKYSDLRTPCSLRDNGDEVVQIGGLVLDDDMNPARAFCHYCDLLMPAMPEKAYSINGIALGDVRSKVENIFLEEVVVKWIPEIMLEDSIIFGYNAEFDVHMIAQSMRNFYGGFRKYKRVTSPILPDTGNWVVDVMSYLPKRVKLTSLYSSCSTERELFYRNYANKLKLETNAPELLEPTISQAHNSLYDAIETYLVLKTHVWGKKLFVGR